MADVHDKATRSYNMSRIKGKNTKPEILVRKYLFSKGFRYRLHDKKLPGKPDIVLPKYKTVIFINGCFWHGHEGCRYFVVPKTRTEWWMAKINNNRQNDINKKKELEDLGWRVITLWECEIKSMSNNHSQSTIIELISK
ncbi:MAG: DNA mismatch endonuclease Vsr [Lentimicrobium sp.]|jgi:DNA mismatch endonuclease (patch repair protein)|nr:DNA mismatch endonuclease Vsr [Lentimicrobium sp.]